VPVQLPADLLGMLAIVCPLCFFAGFVDAIGGGGGLISLPAFHLAGLPPKLMAGTNKLSASVGTLIAVRQFMRGEHVLWRFALPAVALALPGSWLGTTLLNALPDRQILRMLALLMPMAAAVVLLRRGSLKPLVALPGAALPFVCAATGLVIGFYDGLVGPGTGTFLILAFALVMGIDPVSASGTAKVVNLASNLASVVTQIASGHVVFALGLPAAAFSAVGGALGARMAMRGGARVIRAMMLGVMVLLLATLAGEAFFS